MEALKKTKDVEIVTAENIGRDRQSHLLVHLPEGIVPGNVGRMKPLEVLRTILTRDDSSLLETIETYDRVITLQSLKSVIARLAFVRETGLIYYFDETAFNEDDGRKYINTDDSGRPGTYVALFDFETIAQELEQNIADEADAREEGDSALQGALDAEVSARGEADTALQGALDAEARTRDEAITQLNELLEREQQNRSNAIAAVHRAIANENHIFSHWLETGETNPEIEFVGTDDATLTPIFDNLVSTEDVAEAIPFKVYPNPNNGKFIISFDLDNQINATINIYDMLGQKAFTTTKSSVENTIEIDLRNQPKGIYWLSVETNEGRRIRKLVIEN